MPEEIKTAQTTENTEVDSHADVDKDTETLNDVEFTDNSDSDTPQGGDAKKETEEQPQTKEQNSENARRRREAERKAELERERQTAREQAIIETLNGKNPYTGEEMKDSTDVQEYLTMREIEKNGGDPLSDYPKHLKQKEERKPRKTVRRRPKRNGIVRTTQTLLPSTRRSTSKPLSKTSSSKSSQAERSVNFLSRKSTKGSWKWSRSTREKPSRKQSRFSQTPRQHPVLCQARVQAIMDSLRESKFKR